MAGGMLTKQADALTAKFLNDVNDATQGGTLVSVPTGAPQAAVSQLIAGDRIVLDDPTAAGLSDTVIGTLLGGVYCYVKATSVTRPILRGCVAFWKTADLGVAYTAYSDPDPTAAHPAHVFGLFINAITSGSFGWILVAGAGAGQFTDTALTSANDGAWVTVEVSTATAATKGYPLQAGASPTEQTLAAHMGVACGLPSSTVISTVMLTRGTFCGRI